VKILVPCKRVPNPDLKLKVANGSVDLASTTWQVNPFDEYAVEAALRLTEKGKGGERVGEVVVVSIGPKDTAAQLKQLLAMGANRATLIAGDDSALDPTAVARILRAVVDAEKA
jgi:electron transfer flavoprotein beta subunit